MADVTDEVHTEIYVFKIYRCVKKWNIYIKGSRGTPPNQNVGVCDVYPLIFLEENITPHSMELDANKFATDYLIFSGGLYKISSIKIYF